MYVCMYLAFILLGLKFVVEAFGALHSKLFSCSLVGKYFAKMYCTFGALIGTLSSKTRRTNNLKCVVVFAKTQTNYL